MNNEMVELVEKFGILLLGWLLGLATTLVQKKSRIRTLKTALEKEIADARKWLLNSKRHLEYMIQLCVIGEISNHGPVKIPVHIYKSNFAEATLKLNEGERGSFHAIYTRIDQLNDKYDELMELNKACGDDNTKMRQLAGALELYYCNVWTTLHLIDFHLRNRKALNRVFHNAPELGEERAKEMYDEMNARLMQLAQEARELGPERIRDKDPDRGAVGRTQQKSVPPPKPGEFYVNDQAMKYRCLKVEGNKITWMLLDSRQNGHVIDATYVQDIEHAHYYSPLNNPAEAARLEQRYQRLLKNSAK